MTSFFRSARLPIATAVLATAIFIADTVTRADLPVAVLYVVVVLLAARFYSRSHFMLVAVGCVALTIVSHLIAPSSGHAVEGIVNTLISIGAIALITPLVMKDQASTHALRQAHDRLQVEVEKQTRQALLLDQTHDSIFLRNVNGVITFWNRGAQELYGWSAEEAVGKVAEDLLKTVFPMPLKEINAAAMRTGRWEGDLVRTKKDGSQVVVASRRSLQRDQTGAAVALLEANNDITDRKRAEEAAQRGEKEVRDVLETIPAIFFAASPDGLATFQNRAWAEYSGLSAEASLGNGWTAAVHPDDVERHFRKWQASLGGKPFEDEVRHRSASGEYRWFLTRGLPLRDEHGNIVKWYGLLTDIEDRKRAECLLAGEKRILEMVAKGDSLTQILDALCRLVEEQARGTLASILLVEGDRLRRAVAPSLPRSFTEAIGETAIGPLAGCCGAAAYRGEQVIVEDVDDPLVANHRDLALRHSLRACWSSPVFSSQRKVIATFTIYYREPRRPSPRDQELVEQITHLAGVAIERRRAEEAVQRSEKELRDVLETMPAMIFVTRPDGFNEYQNPGWPEYSGMPAEAGLGYGWTAAVHPDDLDTYFSKWRASLASGEPYECEARFRDASGEYRWFLTRAVPLRDEHGNIMKWYGIANDIDDRKRAEQERERLRQLEADLAHMNRVSMMGGITASIAHELNQPLAGVVSNGSACLRWLGGDAPNLEEAREAARRIVRDGKRAGEIIFRIRALASKAVTPKTKLDLNETISEVLALVGDETKRRSIAVRTEFADALVPVLGDRVQLQQVVLNIIMNGLDAMNGAVSKRLLITTCNIDPGQVRITVADTGTGIDPDKMEKVFDPFFSTKPHGMGMGLSISRSIIQSHGGRLWVTANEGPGVTTQFTIPQYQEGPVE